MGMELTKGTVRVQVRKDTASNWTTAGTTLAAGEFGFETDTGYLKCGDGSTAWGSLKYVGSLKIVDGDGDNLHTNIGDTWTLTEGAGIDINHTDTGSPTYATTITCDLTGEELSSALTAGGNATDGHVLTAVGDGTAAWEASAGGGGGTAYWCWQEAGRWLVKQNNWYFPSTAFGPNYYAFSSSLSSTSLPSTWNDAYCPCIVVPKDCTLTDYHTQGNFVNAATWEFALMYGPPVTFGSSGDYSLVQVGATQEEVSVTPHIQYRVGQSGLSVSLAEGGVLVPCLRRTTTDTATSYYHESVISIVAEIS